MAGDSWWDRTWVGVLNRMAKQHQRTQNRWQEMVTELATELVAVKIERDMLHTRLEDVTDERDLLVSMLTDQALHDWAEWQAGNGDD